MTGSCIECWLKLALFFSLSDRDVPFKKTETRMIDYLVKEEVDSILEVCDLSCWLGRRDRLMISILYNTGVRVSELVSIKIKDIILNKNGINPRNRKRPKGKNDYLMEIYAKLFGILY